jgi:hypothetical protein
MTPSRQKQSATLLSFPGAQPDNARAVIAAAFKAHRLPELLAAQLLRDAHRHCDAKTALTEALAVGIKSEPLDLDKARGILLIGACGAGKSLVAEKIRAAGEALGRSVLLLSGREGLARFRAGALPQNCLVVMEADGFHPLNPRARGAFSALSEIEGVEGIGVVSALADAEDVREIVAAFRFRRVVVTGLDRTRRLGALIAAVMGGARLAHVVRGPEGPLENLELEELASALLEPVAH